MNIITRGQWGAKYRDGFGTRTLPAKAVFLHHSVTPSAGPSASLAQDAVMVRKLEYVGYVRFGGMPYTYVITEAGRVFQGHSTPRIGAHTRGYNTTGIGIALLGNYENLTFNSAQQTALVELLKYLRAAGYLHTSAVLRGHYQVAATACPGKNTKPLIGAIEARSRKITATPTIVPSNAAWVDPAKCTSLNVRKGPGTKYAIKAVLPARYEVGVLYVQPTTGWVNIIRGPADNPSAALVGWVHGAYLTNRKPTNAR